MKRLGRIYVLLVFTGAMLFFGMIAPMPTFETRKLEALGRQIERQFGWSGTAELRNNRQVCGKKLLVRFNSDGQVSHLGLKLFPDGVKQQLDPEISEFLERQCLEMCLEDQQGKLGAKLKEYKMALYLNQVPWGGALFQKLEDALQVADNSAAFRLTKDSLNYSAVWENQRQQSFEIRFPTQYNLISGRDKKELDDQLEMTLKGSSGSGLQFEDIQQLKVIEKEPGMWLSSPQKFMIPAVGDSRYFRKSADGQLVWLYDSRFPRESLANLFYYLPDSSKQVQLKMTHRKYGKDVAVYTIPLASVLAAWQKNFRTYVGFEKSPAGELKAVVFFYNSLGNYLHLLSVNVSETDLFEKHELEVELRSFIPEHNIKNLFGECREAGAYVTVNYH